LVERDLAKVEVAGSKPVSRSSLTLAAIEFAVGETRTALGMSGAAGAHRARS